MVEIQVTSLDVAGAAAAEAATLLSDDERLRGSRFARDRERRRFTVARAELRRQLGARLGVPPRTIAFAYGPYGKPRLAGQHGRADLRFSVSHCGGVAAFAFATGREIGVDIETLRPIRDAERIVARLCSPAERRAYESLAEHQRLRGFLNWWTRKEACVKAHGAGLSHPLNGFDVSLASGAPARVLRVADDPRDGAGWVLRAFAPGQRLVGAVAFANSRDDAEPEARPQRVVVRPLPPPADAGSGDREG